MNDVNYDKLMLEFLKKHGGERLLLHSCCAPCSSYCLEEVGKSMKTTVFFYNPNLDCAQEYEKRKCEQIRFLRETGLADFLDCDYSHGDFDQIAKGFEDEREGGARCGRCFRLRLEATARTAKEKGYTCFGTTLTLSPLKNARLINRLGSEIGELLGIAYLPSDFKKRGGYLRSVELSKQYDLYRQNYCGCEYSKTR